MSPPDRARDASANGDAGPEEALPAYCARPLCRAEFRRAPGPGRRQEYCSELCRRTAEREYRRATKRLAHFEAQVEQLRIDVAAFGRSVPSDFETEAALTPEMRRAAEDAVVRVDGVLAFLKESEEPLVAELRALHAAVAPVLKR